MSTYKKMSLGETIRLDDELLMKPFPYVETSKIKSGKVVFIHPQKRFVTLAFTAPSGKQIRESYILFGMNKSRED